MAKLKGKVVRSDLEGGFWTLEAEDGSTVTGPEVHDDPAGSIEPGSDLADVHLMDASADHAAHGRESTLPRCVGRRPDRSGRTSVARRRFGRGTLAPRTSRRA